MKATATKTLIAVIAGLAVIGDAFLLFVKPQLSAGTAGGTGTNAASGAAIGGSRIQSMPSQSGSDTDSADGSASSSEGMTDGTYTSVATPNEYGEVQLQVTVSGGKITDIAAVAYPNHTSRSQGISAQAIPQLIDRAISAQSSDIQYVSGATETSTAFANSLQDAINQSLNAGK